MLPRCFPKRKWHSFRGRGQKGLLKRFTQILPFFEADLIGIFYTFIMKKIFYTLIDFLRRMIEDEIESMDRFYEQYT